MDIDLTDEFLQYLISEPESNEKDSISNEKFAKQTLLPSPVISQIIPSFKVKINKPFQGSSSLSFNDEDYQTLIAKEEDSQLDVFDDVEETDDLLIDSAQSQQVPTNFNDQNSKLKNIQIMVKLSTIIVDDVEFLMKAPIRSSCVIKSSALQEEDHLLLSLESGYLIVIKIFFVPRQITDVNYELQNKIIKDQKTSIFRPFVIQWWDTKSTLQPLILESSGYQLRSSSSGQSTISCSYYNSIRLFLTSSQTTGTVLRKHYNIKADGAILETCFITNNDSQLQTDLLLSLNFTNSRRLNINLFTWSNQQSEELFPPHFSKSVLPLDNQFIIPSFIVPLQQNQSFLFVSPNKLLVISIHDIISAEYNFTEQDVPWNSAFPTTFYVPSSKIYDQSDSADEVLVATDNGFIYLISIEKGSVKSTVIVKISEGISKFIFERRSTNYNLIYSNICGSSKHVLIENLLNAEVDMEAESTDISKIHTLKRYGNWTPLLEYSLVKGSTSKKQELWGITGLGKKSKLNHFRYGFAGIRTSFIYEKLRKVLKLWKLDLNQSRYLLCALPYENVMLEFQENSKDVFIEIQDPLICLDEPTLFTSVLDGIVIQITSKSFILSNLTDVILSQSINDGIHSNAELHSNYLILLVDNNSATTLQIFRVAPGNITHESNVSDHITLISEHALNYQPSMLKVLEINDLTMISMGDYNGVIYFYDLSNLPQITTSLSLKQSCPYDLNDNIRDTNHLIPHSIVVNDEELLIGTKEGYLIKYDINDTSNPLNFWKLGDNQIDLSFAIDDCNILYIQCNELWLLNKYESNFPVRVYFDDTYERQISTFIELENTDNKFKRLVIIRDNGLVLTKISTFFQQAVKQVSIGESGSKMLFLPHISTFLVLTKSKSNKNRIKCLDKKAFKLLNHDEFQFKIRSNETEEFIFGNNEYPISCCLWEIDRGSKITKKVLVGCKKLSAEQVNGVVKVLDFKKSKSEHESSIIVTVLTSFDHESPISNINQYGEIILYTSESQIYYNSYEEKEKRFTPIKLLKTLPSRVISMNITGDCILLSTESDSLFEFNIPKMFNAFASNINLIASDPNPNAFIGSVPIGPCYVASNKMSNELTIFTKSTSSFNEAQKIKISCISRVAKANLSNRWTENLINSTEDCILSIGVNGEIFCLRRLNEDNKQKVATSSRKLEKLDTPFINKISGTGLFSLNKPIFGFKDERNSIPIVDLDLQEIVEIDKLTL